MLVSTSRADSSRRRLVVLSIASLAAVLALASDQPKPARSQAAQPAAIWIEGEAANRHDFNQHNWYSRDGLRMTQLSPGRPGGPAGDWLAHYSNGPTEPEARYDLDVSVPGSYTLWMRASSFQTSMWYALDGGQAVDIDMDADPRETLRLNEPPAIDLRFISWYRVAELDLDAGAHRLVFGLRPRRQGGQETHGGIDAIALANFAWAPSGGMRPEIDPPEPAPDDWYPLIPTDDPFDPASVTDLSPLIEAPAGQRGPLERDGDALRFADGSPVKLWGVNAAIGGSDAVMERQARHYVKHGINLVRLHPVQAELGLLQRDPDSGERRLDPQRLDRLDRWFHTLKQQGIYMQWSLFYPHVITPDDGYSADLYAELPDSGAGKSTSGFVNLMPQLQAAEWAWAEQLLTHRNPYTGLRYFEDPALAVVEVHNEDSIFWHYPLNPLAAGDDGGRSLARHQAAVQRMWMEWLQGRYGSTAELLAAWGPSGQGSRPGDALDNPAMPIYGAWEMESDGPWNRKGETARMGDFTRFLAEAQRGYFSERVAQLRALGFEGVTVTTAWQAGGPSGRLANLWTDTAADMIDRHSYFGGHENDPFWRITEGPVRNDSHLSRPGTGILATGFEQIEDRPFMISEWSQQPPNEWKAEIAPLVAFYGFGLQGWDASTHFHSALPRIGGGWPSDLTPWSSDTPAYMGQFPALARAIHQGHIQEGDAAAARRLNLDDIFRGVDAIEQQTPSGGWDSGPGSLATPREVFALGRVSTHFNDATADLGRSARSDWSATWDQADQVLRSATGDLTWDYGERVVTVTADRTQAVIGFAGGGSFDLPGAWIEVDTPFVSLILTALDDRPIGQSGHILVSAMARDLPTGAIQSEDGGRLENFGNPPLMLEPVQARITLKGAPIVSARPLDIHGVPQAVELDRESNTVQIDGRYRTWLYELRTEGQAEPTPTAVDPGPSATRPASPEPTTGPGESPTPEPDPRGDLLLPWLGLESR